MPEIEFIQPGTLKEALHLLADSRKKKGILAGGTDIIPGIRIGSGRFKSIRRLIDIHHLPELNFISFENGNLRIGSVVTFAQIAENEKIKKSVPLLAESARSIGSIQIRNRATIGGNFVNNAPCADSVPPLLVYDARITILSAKGKRELSLQEFLSGPYKTALKPQELVSEISIPLPGKGYRGVFYKLGRRRGVAVSRISLAILIKQAAAEIKDIRIASGAVTPIGMRFPHLDKAFIGVKPSSKSLKKLARSLGQEILQVTGIRWSTPYKLPVVQQVFYKLLCDLMGIKP
jgi:CO/xanthine dehydrogenase FAD-binding subunit